MSSLTDRAILALLTGVLALASLQAAGPSAASAQATDNHLSETAVTGSTEAAAAPEADQYYGGTGLHAVGKEGDPAVSPAAPPEKKDKTELKQLFASCQAQDVGSDSLWKYPSESWGDGAAFIPPQNACKTAEILDSAGKKTGKFRVVRNYISGIYMCADKACVKRLGFDAIGFGEFCVWRVHRSSWQKYFGGSPFGVVMLLQDGRFIRWDLKDPAARNGMPPYRDLKYKVAPYCYRPLR